MPFSNKQNNNKLSLLKIPSFEHLKMPLQLKLEPQYSIVAKIWPLLRFNRNIVLPITSTVHRARRTLIIPVNTTIINSPSTQRTPDRFLDSDEKSMNRPKYEDQVKMVQTACNYLSLPNSKNDEKMSTVNIKNVVK